MKKKNTFIPLNFRPYVKGGILEETHIAGIFKIKENITEKKTKRAIICIYIKEDENQTEAIKKHVVGKTETEIVFLTYDDLGYTWNFSLYRNDLKFYTKNGIIEPIGIYIRLYCPDIINKRFHLYNNLIRAVEYWEGPIIGAKSIHFQNSSKAYQLTNTVRDAIKKCKNNSFIFPTSYFVKGLSKYLELLKKTNTLVVKSCSGIRSEVATYKQFKNWNTNNLNSLPVFFQELCNGPDIRVHYMHENCWSIIVSKKEGSVDYRYAKTKDLYKKYEVDKHLKSFCMKLAEIESLKLIGVDFIKFNNIFVCLESNPSPGWAGFHKSSQDESDLAITLINKLSERSTSPRLKAGA